MLERFKRESVGKLHSPALPQEPCVICHAASDKITPVRTIETVRADLDAENIADSSSNPTQSDTSTNRAAIPPVENYIYKKTIAQKLGINKFTDIPLWGLAVKRIGEEVEKYGLQKGAELLIGRVCRKLKVHGKEGETARVLREEPVLMICEEDRYSTPIPYHAALPQRENISVLCSLDQARLLPDTFAKYLIPIDINHAVDAEENNSFWNWTTISRRFRTHIPRKESDKINARGLRQAKTNLINGGLVTIFPNAYRGKGGEWLPGVGYIIESLRKRPNTYVLYANVKGTGKRDIFRLIFYPLKYISPGQEVYFSKPRKVGDILKKYEDTEKRSPAELIEMITRDQQEEYRNWAESLAA